jgi:transposase-like protein
MYLYRAVDERGKTVESHLSRTRDKAAAKAFFRKVLKHHGQPRTITLDGFEATHSALDTLSQTPAVPTCSSCENYAALGCEPAAASQAV